ncbi:MULTISPECIES: class I fructose-bisphosphate aldolase [Pantoea]|jgi:class I fructose-bisphosphate aldolase|uniref:Aldolase YneB n=1 Tax=Pantoea ananatis (strain AJ13355) TaxID=932677 RepID=A0A0H3L376_PANAA|nr:MULTISPECIES: aldolase YneB [Pantoea]MBA4820744.1 fructose-bisphosphate aldolase [Pantoea ananatis]MDI3366536.1 fructose-bisphosphate aldolase [Pantoea sp. V108_6]MDJ0033300.1 fructose-bisphosphate aldolase [Pantoea ananatis]MDJ0046105.1 fructose-bisphosphate aldolase [Pantoea ananatis]PQK94249.1 fructose-bisphosphate aldolase [Pantoea ananatis]
MFLGKEIRLKRLLNKKSGRLLAITMDHPITRGVLPGIGPINEVMGKVVAGKPDAITMHKGIIEKSFAPYADTDVSIIMKATSYAIPYHEAFDTPVADVDEAIRVGADAISVGCILGGPEQAKQLTFLGQITKAAGSAGLPVVAHIYPKGPMVENPFDAKHLAYCVRAGAELGVDIIKTLWSGSADTFKEVVASCPAKVALAGGDMGNDLVSFLTNTRKALDVGVGGVTYGRFVWQHDNPTAVIRALDAMINDDSSVDEAIAVYKQAGGN